MRRRVAAPGVRVCLIKGFSFWPILWDLPLASPRLGYVLAFRAGRASPALIVRVYLIKGGSFWPILWNLPLTSPRSGYAIAYRAGRASPALIVRVYLIKGGSFWPILWDLPLASPRSGYALAYRATAQVVGAIQSRSDLASSDLTPRPLRRFAAAPPSGGGRASGASRALRARPASAPTRL